MFEVTVDLLAVLLAVAFVAGLVDSIAGGGGLITLPTLLLVGASPIEALSTNKLQGTFGAATAAVSYARGGHVDLRSQWLWAFIAFGAALAGALMATVLPVETFRVMLPIVLISVALFFAFKPNLTDVDTVAKVAPAVFGFTFVPAVGAYDGLLGPGAGSFYMIAFVMFAGFGVLRATAHTKLLNFASNVGGLVMFALVAEVWWATGLAMGAAQIAGARMGSAMAMKQGARLIKPLVVVTSLALAARLMWDWF
ncbi:TSUP family transporter [Nereida sp. MMG025]|uniref:TSUP family transporter n=1 Tax=Nereida sp. MMG025 TaxID=2909981 RepID=UPI001F00C793|nr:TSUP family transporter [Nereida sp. MMG025]MCF6444734.1 TSUP family transporter [Nereida sp. MMG025]